MTAGKPLKPAHDWPDYGSAVERDRERTPGMTDEWTDDEEQASDPDRMGWATLGTIADCDDEDGEA